MKKGFKKTVSLLLSSLVLASAISFSAGAAQIKTDDADGSGHLQVYSWTDSPSYTDGDVNRDGVVSIADVTCVQKYLVELLTLDQAQLLLADVNQDGEVSIADATLIQMMIAN